MAEASSPEQRVDPKPAHPAERRASPRIKMEVQVGLSTDTNFFTGYSEDLSDGGLFIATYLPLKVGTSLELSIVLPEGEPIAARGRVVWAREAHDGAAAGVGVALESVSEAGRALILEFVGLRSPLFYDF